MTYPFDHPNRGMKEGHLHREKHDSSENAPCGSKIAVDDRIA
jgi:hypothetical protein